MVVVFLRQAADGSQGSRDPTTKARSCPQEGAARQPSASSRTTIGTADRAKPGRRKNHPSRPPVSAARLADPAAQRPDASPRRDLERGLAGVTVLAFRCRGVLRDRRGQKTGELSAETLPGDTLDNGAMFFPNPGVPGIYLLKLHGALDIFTSFDGKVLVKLCPVADSQEGYVAALRAANSLVRPMGALTPAMKSPMPMMLVKCSFCGAACSREPTNLTRATHKSYP